ncbi:marine proteobacterial sortase target protein [Sphingorhabdus arenilitoris]|uniref:Marine proteobacterial sortase target protein n=1 Tax=Sphingorhabdus arenilitoris TaxID=1490041 RepID=A0ABV8RIW3_9SPHN
MTLSAITSPSILSGPTALDIARGTPKARISRSLLPLAAMLLAIPAGAVLAAPAFAMQAADAAEDGGPQSGTLMLAHKDGSAQIPAVQLGTDMEVTVTGNIARVRVTQAFRNVSADWMEATYLYPLPEDAAVDSLKMTVGNRVIIGKIKKREEAREIYEEAMAEGKKAGLVEQLRPNMFTNSVANIGPGETVLIVIEYQMPLRQLDGVFSLRLPLVVAPRYIPPHSIDSGAAAQDAAAIVSAPLVDPKRGEKTNPVSITVHLDPGFVPANVDSAYHKVAIDGKGAKRTVKLAQGQVPADKDFELSWRSASADPTLSLYKQQFDGSYYIMASLTPPANDKSSFIPPREMVFVIDNSGSMTGDSMAEAKKSLIHALGTLRPQDHFNIIRFDDTLTQLFDVSVPASAEKIAEAKAYTETLEANGGTEMLPALIAALKDDAITPRATTLRQVIFLTDGSISNETEMLAAIGADNGNSRVFMVGIGSAPNGYLMSRMATMGRGIYTNIGEAGEVTAKMAKLLDMLSRPAMQDLKVSVAGNSFDLTPSTLPDLYAGEPLLLLGRSDRLEGQVTVSGHIGKVNWTRTIDLSSASESPAVAKLWARRRIDDIEADSLLGKIEYEAGEAQIAELGLRYSLVTSQTSLVAVEEERTRPKGEPLRKEDLPINLPEGWDFDGLFGGDTAAAAIANEAHMAQLRTDKQFQLPQTATNYALRLLLGLFAFGLGLIGLTFSRRKKEI